MNDATTRAVTCTHTHKHTDRHTQASIVTLWHIRVYWAQKFSKISTLCISPIVRWLQVCKSHTPAERVVNTTNALSFRTISRAHDDIFVIVVEEEECVTVKISESPACTKIEHELNRGFVLYLASWSCLDLYRHKNFVLCQYPSLKVQEVKFSRRLGETVGYYFIHEI